jgi:hypothetical protein
MSRAVSGRPSTQSFHHRAVLLNVSNDSQRFVFSARLLSALLRVEN